MKNNKISIMDLLTFAKAGYTPADVKEIMAMQTEPEADTEGPSEDDQKDETQPDKAKEPNAAPAEDKKAEPDYKAMFEAQQKQIEELTNNLQKAQAANINKNLADDTPKKSAQELVNDIFRDVIN